MLGIAFNFGVRMKTYISALCCIGLIGCASTENNITFSGQPNKYQEPKDGPVAYLSLETTKKTDGFGFQPHPHTAIIYERCQQKDSGKTTFGYVGDLQISTALPLGNPATIKVKADNPIFLAFGLIHPVNGYKCMSKHLFTPENGKTYTFTNSTSWSACPTEAGVISQDGITPINNMEILDNAAVSELLEKGININREPCNT